MEIMYGDTSGAGTLMHLKIMKKFIFCCIFITIHIQYKHKELGNVG